MIPRQRASWTPGLLSSCAVGCKLVCISQCILAKLPSHPRHNVSLSSHTNCTHPTKGAHGVQISGKTCLRVRGGRADGGSSAYDGEASRVDLTETHRREEGGTPPRGEGGTPRTPQRRAPRASDGAGQAGPAERDRDQINPQRLGWRYGVSSDCTGLQH